MIIPEGKKAGFKPMYTGMSQLNNPDDEKTDTSETITDTSETITDTNSTEKPDNSKNKTNAEAKSEFNWLWIVIPSVELVLICGGIIILLLVKRKKQLI